MKLHKTWWGETFVNSLVSFIDEGRLQRGRAYRTERRILSFLLEDNRVEATIRGNVNPYFGVYKEPKYKIKIAFKKIPINEWKSIIAKICEHPGWLSKLMLNEIPTNIDHEFSNKKYSLLPKAFSDVEASCSCPDYENPCKHIAGVYYRLAEMLDSNPMLLFPMHGLPIEQLQKELKKSDFGKAFAEKLSFSEDIDVEISKKQFFPIVITPTTKTQHITQNAFWNMPSKMPLNIADSSQEPISASIVKKQGDYPAFWNRHNSFILAMENIYFCIRTKNRKKLLGSE